MQNEQTGITLLHKESAQLQAIMALNKKGGDIATMVAQEISYLESVANSKPAIKQCEPISALLALKSVLKQNLTLDPHAGLVYVKTRNVNAGTQAKPEWKVALEIQPTCNGLISIARQCGRILDIKRPQVTKNVEGRVTGVSVELLLPSVPQPRWEEFKFDEDDFYRWQRASHKDNSRNKQDANNETFNYANDNYTNFKSGIDPEFARAKAIRHAVKKLGTNQNEMKPGQMIIHNIAPIVDAIKAEEETNDTITDVNHEVVDNDLPKGEEL